MTVGDKVSLCAAIVSFVVSLIAFVYSERFR